MYKKTISLLALSLLTACGSDDDLACSSDAVTSHASPTQITLYIPNYIYATENTNAACYAHGLDVIELRNSYSGDDTYDYTYTHTNSCLLTAHAATSDIAYYPSQDYRMDTIAEKFTGSFENLDTTEVEELTNLICGRSFGDESFAIDNLESFEVTESGGLIVNYMIGDLYQSKSIHSSLDHGFNCPLYSFSCQDAYTNQVDSSESPHND